MNNKLSNTVEQREDRHEKLALAAEGILAGYYCVLWKGPYYITVTGEDSEKRVGDSLSAQVDSVNIKGYTWQPE